MQMSESTTNLFTALIKARTDIETVVKDKAGFGYNYATLDNVIGMLKNVLPSYDLGYAQFPETENGKDGVTTIVMHKSGEFMSARYEMDATPMKGTNITQQKGASITYIRRYALCSIFGIPTEEDVDGNIEPQNDDKPENKSSVEDVIKGMELMTIGTTKKFYAKAIELYPKGTPEYKKWIEVWVAKKDALEQKNDEEFLNQESEYLNNI